MVSSCFWVNRKTTETTTATTGSCHVYHDPYNSTLNICSSVEDGTTVVLGSAYIGWENMGEKLCISAFLVFTFYPLDSDAS